MEKQKIKANISHISFIIKLLGLYDLSDAVQ